MRYLLLNLFLGMIWVSLTGEFTRWNFIIGLALGFVIMLIFRETFSQSGSYFRKFWQFVYFVLFFIWELILANLRVAWEVLTPDLHMHPAIIGIPLDLKSELEITILANLITLTPGTLSLDVSDDNKTLYVHAMYVDDPDAFRRSIKEGFEQRVKDLFSA